MERIYRGYPLPQPYMLYRREDQKGSAPDDRIERERDMEYFFGLYPRAVRRSQSLVEEGCDAFDYPGSPIYDRYPDREAIARIRDRILKNARDKGMEADRDLIELLLLHEILRRRV